MDLAFFWRCCSEENSGNCQVEVLEVGQTRGGCCLPAVIGNEMRREKLTFQDRLPKQANFMGLCSQNDREYPELEGT